MGIASALLQRRQGCKFGTTTHAGEDDMASLTSIAEKFFDACETGKGWESCSAYCSADATFSAQASPLSEVKTLAQYTDWMKGMMGLFPDARYELKSFATDEARKSVVAYAVF